MRSLFLRIFLWFWVTVIATGVALILTFILEPSGVPSRWHATLTDTARYAGIVAIETTEKDGLSSTAAYLDRFRNEAHINACLFDSSGNPLAGRNCLEFQDMTLQAAATHKTGFTMKHGITRVAIALTGKSGRAYIFATELVAGPRAAFGINRGSAILQWGVALLVSGLICFVLARYLTAPILGLRSVSQQLAGGDLSARAGPELERRRDELGHLAIDFNTMVSRIEGLVSRQRQLISDISHELRSPLARLNVALDLARNRKGADPAFEQMQEDLSLIDEMIGRLLTIAKLDISAPQVPMKAVDVEQLVSQIVRAADFEAQGETGGLSFVSSGPCVVHGSEELLRSAIENVVRNAIRYTNDGTAAEINLETDSASKAGAIRLTVRDYGPGVPEAELENIFQPFYRVADSRDRQSGGTGLGLAIAYRVVQLHGGSIRARNAVPSGLLVEILLPSKARSA